MPESNKTDNKKDINKVDSKLLEILVCPETKMPLIFDGKKNELVSRSARLAYPIREGIPIMLSDQARKLSDDEYKKL